MSAAGIVITASHNPWTDNGFKVKAPTGAAAGAEILSASSRRSSPANGGKAIERRPLEDAEAAGLVEWYDPYPGYEQFVRRTIDLDALKAADVSILVEPLYGAGSGWIPRLLAGGRIRVTEIHNERNPYFGGVNPEPIRPHVDQALAMLAADGFDLGLLLDGDADRAGAADERGTFLHQLEVTGLLMYYLGRASRAAGAGRGQRQQHLDGRRAGRSITGSRRTRSRSGFKFIGPKMIETGAMLGAEESGGYGFGMHLPERDGIYADLMLLDLFLKERERGTWPVSRIVERFHELAGPSFYRRIDVHFQRAEYDDVKRRVLVGLREQPPTALAGEAIVRTQVLDTGDGFKWFLSDGSWLLVRASGTEPLVRVYTEAVAPAIRDELVVTGERLVRGG